MSPPIIQARDLSRVYRQGLVEVHALRGVNLDVRSGEFTALAGPSGSGKTTLLNLVGCLDSATAGTITLRGESVAGLSKGRAAAFRLENIGFVFQAFNLVPVLTAYENAEFTLMLQGVARRDRRAIVAPLMERVGLADMMNRRPHELSGGQQQRVAVVRAIAPKPAIVLADEPTANLDGETSCALLDMMLGLNSEDGVTFVFSTHDPNVISRARRVVRLESGRVVNEGASAASGVA